MRVLYYIVFLIAVVFTCNEVKAYDTMYCDPYTLNQVKVGEIKETKVDIEHYENKVIVDYQLGTLCFDRVKDTALYALSLQGFGHFMEEGVAELPFKVDFITLPVGASNVRVALEDIDSVSMPITLVSYRGIVYNSEAERFSREIIVRPSGSTDVDSVVKIHLLGARGVHPVIGVEIRPFRYKADKKELVIYNSFRYRVCYENNQSRLASVTPVKPYGEYSQSLLIVARESYRDVIRSFVEWKRQSGLNVIEKYIKNGIFPSSDDVANIIKDTYSNADNLQYVLIIGDNGEVPGATAVYKDYVGGEWRTGKFQTDFHYSCIDNDDIPDLYVGRIPARSAEMAYNSLRKILRYEKNPPVNENYYRSSIHTAIFATDSPDEKEETCEPGVYTSELIRNYVSELGINCSRNYSAYSSVSPKYWGYKFGDGTEIPEELQRPNYSWDGTVRTMIDQINSGVLYCLTNAHGSNKGMMCSTVVGDSEFTSEHADSLMNCNLPIFINISCHTGNFSKRDGTVLCPELNLTQALLSSNAETGAVAAYAFSDYSIMGMDDVIAYGLFNGIWPEPGFICPMESKFLKIDTVESSVKYNHTLGYAFRRAQDYAISKFGVMYSEAKHNIKSFHLFGDPSMLIHTRCPEEIENTDVKITEYSDLGQIFSDMGKESDSDGKILGNISVRTEDCEGIVVTIMDSDSIASSFRSNSVLKAGVSLPATVIITAPNKIPYTRKFFSANMLPTLKLKNLVLREGIEGEIVSSDATDIHKLYEDIRVGVFSLEGAPVAILTVKSPDVRFSIPTGKFAGGMYVVVVLGNGAVQDSKSIVLN